MYICECVSVRACVRTRTVAVTTATASPQNARILGKEGIELANGLGFSIKGTCIVHHVSNTLATRQQHVSNTVVSIKGT